MAKTNYLDPKWIDSHQYTSCQSQVREAINKLLADRAPAARARVASIVKKMIDLTNKLNEVVADALDRIAAKDAADKKPVVKKAEAKKAPCKKPCKKAECKKPCKKAKK